MAQGELRESEPEESPSGFEALYDKLNREGKGETTWLIFRVKERADGLVKYFLDTNNVRGLKEVLEGRNDTIQSPLDEIKDRKLRKGVAKLLAQEINDQIRIKKSEKKLTKDKKPVQEAAPQNPEQKKPAKTRKFVMGENPEDARMVEEGEKIRQLREQLEGSPEEKERQELLAEIDRRGRLGIHTSVSGELGRKRGVNDGFQSFIDEKSEDQSANLSLKRAMNSQYDTYRNNEQYYGSTPAFQAGNITREFFEKENIGAMVTIAPLVIEEPKFEKKIIKKGFIFKKSEEIDEMTGLEQKPMSIGKLNGKNEDTESAYRIFYLMHSTRQNPYIDMEGERHGNMFQGHIMLPESIAKKAFTQIQQDPSFIKVILRTLDPELMKEEEKPLEAWQGSLDRGIMPKVSRILIVPEGESLNALQREPQQKSVATGINPKYIKECEPF